MNLEQVEVGTYSDTDGEAGGRCRRQGICLTDPHTMETVSSLTKLSNVWGKKDLFEEWPAELDALSDGLTEEREGTLHVPTDFNDMDTLFSPASQDDNARNLSTGH